MSEYIYILNYFVKDLKEAIKIGSTKFPHFRLQTYQTGMFYNLQYNKLYQVSHEFFSCYEIDELFRKTFITSNYKYLYNKGGNEWYDSTLITFQTIEEFFIDYDINFKSVELLECPKDINKTGYLFELLEKQDKPWLYGFKNDSFFKLQIQPYLYQQEVLNNLDEFKKYKKGKLLWACGLGKTYMSLFICHQLNVNNILICVPTKYLIEQFYNAIKNMFNYTAFRLCDDGDDIKIIEESLDKNKHNIIISTYHSVSKLLDYEFDIKIGDEAHHLVSEVKPENKNTFDKFHKIKSNYSLFMTATEKKFDYENDEVYTMSSEKDFGCLIDKKSVKWAIENKKITDYEIICLQNSSEELKKIMKQIKLDVIINKIAKNKDININKEELFFSAYSALKMISEGKSFHMLIYANKCYSADIIKSIIDSLLENNIFENLNPKDIYNECLTSYKNIDLDDEISQFKSYKYGIISCVYIFGEGVDIPKLDSVVIAERMTTEIRIVQSCLRPNRLDRNQPDKKAKIIIPLNIGKIDDKLKMVISHMANEDDIIEQKIKVFKVINKKTKKKDSDYLHEIKMKLSKTNLNKIIYNLYKSGSFGRNLSLQKEYELYQEKVLFKKFNSIKEYQDGDMEHKNPHIYFTSVWTNWFDFLKIDTSNWIQTLLEWKEYCKKNNINSSSEYYNKLDEKMPPEPGYFYSNFKGIHNELSIRKRRYSKTESDYMFL